MVCCVRGLRHKVQGSCAQTFSKWQQLFIGNFAHRLQFLLRFHSVQNHEVPDGGENGQDEEKEAGAHLANRVQIREVTEITCIADVDRSGPVQGIAAHCGIKSGHGCWVSCIRGKVLGARGTELEWHTVLPSLANRTSASDWLESELVTGWNAGRWWLAEMQRWRFEKVVRRSANHKDKSCLFSFILQIICQILKNANLSAANSDKNLVLIEERFLLKNRINWKLHFITKTSLKVDQNSKLISYSFYAHATTQEINSVAVLVLGKRELENFFSHRF